MQSKPMEKNLFLTGAESSLKHTGTVTVPDPVAIGLFLGIKSGMEPWGTVFTGIYADILRQIPAKILQNLSRRHGTFTMKIGNLSLRMDTGIGAAAAADLDLLTQYFRQALLDFPLNRIVSAG